MTYRLAKQLDQPAELPMITVPAPKDESTMYRVPDVTPWATWLNPPPADPRVAHEVRELAVA